MEFSFPWLIFEEQRALPEIYMKDVDRYIESLDVEAIGDQFGDQKTLHLQRGFWFLRSRQVYLQYGNFNMEMANRLLHGVLKVFSSNDCLSWSRNWQPRTTRMWFKAPWSKDALNLIDG
jgi:hypothetical protein